MPRYDYRCPACKQLALDLTTLTPPACTCGAIMQRVWAPVTLSPKRKTEGKR